MKKQIFSLALAVLMISGCVPVFVGAGVLTGYALSNDTASGNISVEYRELWDVSYQAFQDEGLEIFQADESKGIIKARSEDARYALKISSLGAKEQRLKVSTRKYLLPHPQAAQNLFFKIVREFE